MIIYLDCGTIQGSILGPLLDAIFVFPLYNHLKLTTFADYLTISLLGGTHPLKSLLRT
jgi:hypothetical protein